MPPTLTRRHLTTSLAALSAMALLAACGSGSDSGDSGDKVRFGYIGDFNGASLIAIADAKGLWKKHGLTAESTVFTNGPLQIQALGTDNLDFGYIGPGAMWLPASGQAKVVAINTLGNSDRVIAQPGIDSMRQLEGKTVAVPEGTSGDMILSLALEKAGMTKDDLKVVPMDPSTIVSAFSSQQVDAAGFWYPATATIKKQVPDLVELARNTDFEDDISFPTAFVAGNKLVADRPEKVKKVLAVLREAIAFRSAHTDEAVELTADKLRVPVDQVEADAANNKLLGVDELDALTRDGTVAKWLTGMNDYFVKTGKLKKPVDPKSYYTGDLFMGAGK
ncbi:aliphatic sulfonate ABC transporter substrate-binding protein [Streptomyces lancefieldiae]|uniref:Aliphatic sulfonate ABC transporter substrate-binding protein n=1 Tax=Streptomyces lancefieldiae TaxID=3075520 RepID=A0ABU3AI19_9ACTN|nr:aliphatic sulfonate ABC transporter substrate-binding protein [Streptomyces sp. DSM 40712]MDT0609182.1 aliphatic sulfonate ABC transporter substrate-binding protein [Streptomyces sp. DSM 40712]